MMDRMRAATQGFFGRVIMTVVLGLIIVSFGFWGIGDFLGGGNANDIATVGGTTVSVEAFRDAYQNELQSLEQKAKRAILPEEARRIGLDRQVLTQLLTEAVLDQEAKKLDLVVGDPAIAAMIMKDDAFKGQNGQFDKARFTTLVTARGSEARYVAGLRVATMRQTLSDAVLDGIAVPKAVAEAINRYQSETRAIDYIDLPPSAAGEIPKATDPDLQKFYEDRKGTYLAPEYRKLVTLAVIPADLVKPDAVSEADVQKRYDDTKAVRFITPEKRTVQQIVFPDEAAAQAAKARLDAGESFDALATAQKLTTKDIDLGTVTKSELADPAVADTAFALPEGAVSQSVKTRFGTALLHVTKIVPTVQQPLIEVSAQLKDEIAIIRAKADATRLRDDIENQRRAGKSLTEIAANDHFATKVIDAIDAQGFSPAHKPVEGIVDGPAVLKAAFDSDIGADTDMITTDNGGYVWYEVAAIDKARQLSLADVHPQVEAAWRTAETIKRLTAKSDAIVKAINGGEPLATIAAKEGNLKVLHNGDMRRGGAPVLAKNVGAAVFSVAVHKAGSAAASEGGRIVFQVQSALVPPVSAAGPDFSQLIAKVKEGYLDDTLGQYLSRLEQTFGVKINSKALANAVGDSGGDSGGS